MQNFITGKLQSPQRVTKYFFTSQKSQIVKPFFTSANIRSRQSHKKEKEKGRGKENEKEKEKEKEREKEKEKKRKERRKRKEKRTEKAGLKIFPFEARRPLRIHSLA